MGEAKRRKEQGLPPKSPKKSESKSNFQSLLVKYPRLPYIFIGIFIVYLIFDVIKYYTS